MSSTILPFFLQLPSGYGLATGGAQNQAAAASSVSSPTSGVPSSAPGDVVSITGIPNAGTFTAAEGDMFGMGDLFRGASPDGQAIAGYRVAMGGGGGKLTLDGTDVSARTSFTADEFAHLSYTAGAQGTSQSLVVVAQTGKRLADGTLSQVVDSAAVQITADVTGGRSINAMNALRTLATGSDANIVSLAQEAAIFTGLSGSPPPSLRTDGNFTAAEGDMFGMGDLFQGAAPDGQTIAGYRVAMGGGGGKLTLDGTDVSARTSFTADEFAHLSYTVGAQGTAQGLVVVAQTGQRNADGSLSQVVDSAAVQITADVTGGRSINAMNALRTLATGSDANIVSLAQEAAIFTGLSGSPPPSLRTDGNFTAAEGDMFGMGDLFQGAAPDGQTIAGYRVAMGGGGGKLTLDGTDVSARTSFTADEFAHLSYTAGAQGTAQNLVVVAQTGQRNADGSLSQVVDSAAVQITADVTGGRSINAMNALRTLATGSDANIVSLAQEAAIFTGLSGSPPPSLRTDGNFTAAEGDMFGMGDLFQGAAPDGQTIAGYRVAMGGGGGKLTLDGTDVSARTSFTADEFAHLSYTAGAQGTAQNLVVVAQTGQRNADGSLSQVVDSAAVQITADVTGGRSINAMNALRTLATGSDANIVSLAQEAAIFTGLSGSPPPSLRTDGNFTAAEGDMFGMGDLFQGAAADGQTIAGYRVAMGGGGGKLTLDGTDVSARTSFTADEFAHLSYTVGAQGTAQGLVVVAQTGQRNADGSLSQVVDSAAVQITAVVTGGRSINAMNALRTLPTGSDANIVSLAQEAAIFTGLSGSAPPTLQTVVTPVPSSPITALGKTSGAYESTGLSQPGSAMDLSLLYPGTLGGFDSAGVLANPGGPVWVALLLLDDSAPGAFQTMLNLTAQSVAVKAYNTSGGS